MNNAIRIAIASATLMFAACTVVTPNKAGSGSYINTEPMKIKKISPVMYGYKAEKEGCSEIEFLKTFVGKLKNMDDGSVMHIDNIMDIHTKVVSMHLSILGLSTDELYECSFWGNAVEYVK